MTQITNNDFDYVGEIWKVADYCRDTIKTSDYNKIILPFALLRRLECALEPTRADVVEAFEQNEGFLQYYFFQAEQPRSNKHTRCPDGLHKWLFTKRKRNF